MPIEPITGASPVASGAKIRRLQAGFAVPEPGEAEAADALPEAPATGPLSLLSLQAAELAGADAAADRAAATQASTLLAAMNGLQLAMLGGANQHGQAALAKLADPLPQAADPALDAVLRAIAQRAAVELARRA